jgi:hypothetical protein
VRALDLTDPGSTPVTVGTGSSPSIDGPHISWIGPDGSVRVAVLPFDTHQQPRLLNGGGPASFNPGIAGAAGTWAALFDATRPLSAWTVTLTNGAGATVKTFTGTSAPLGAARATWDGTTDAGTQAPDGTYTWSFSAQAADGTGTVLAMDGAAGTPHGTVTIARTAATARPATLTAGVSAGTLTYGRRVTVRGTLTKSGPTTAVAGAPIRVYQRRHGTAAWALLASTATTTSGAWSVSTAPAVNTDFYAAYAGAAGSGASSSRPVLVTVAPRISGTAASSAIRLRRTAAVRGTVAPNRRGQVVYLQRHDVRGWHTIVSARLTAASTYAFTVKPTSRGLWRYRVVKGANAYNIAGIGPTVVVRVT